ncbi:L-type lectin-domain containing receptor kinase IX.1 [Vitis vinifera]|uniref:L-type lectin-domain containing receptor kinase IX.1 n=1 Tax=Vitis vinifera TaxID=29760 RepID=A0A438GZV1_VITVI|nr:L-type lectin-domain containing receptor kinase IX.1 [Vitis vinifera]
MAVCNAGIALLHSNTLPLLHIFMVSFFLSLMIPSLNSSLSFSFNDFDPNCNQIHFEGQASYSGDKAIYLTRSQQEKKMNDSWGRATYREPFHLWDKASKRMADFSTNFSFGIDSQGNFSYGEGLAFFLAPYGTQLPSDVRGGSGLGLVSNNQQALNSEANHFFAVEFDTYPNDWDPKYDHVGININSMKSVETQPCLYYKVNLSNYLPEFVTIGFSSATGDLYEKGISEKGLEDPDFDLSMVEDFATGTGPRKLRVMSWFLPQNNFAEAEKLGEGGFGGVYKVSCGIQAPTLLLRGSQEGKTLLTWAMRYKIATGLASALLYLHEEWEQCVVHRDVKSSNVMLDADFNAKLGDFGLARLVDHGKSHKPQFWQGLWGTWLLNVLWQAMLARNPMSTVLEFVALEICCGRKSVEPKARKIRSNWWSGLGPLWSRKASEAADPRLSADFDEKQMVRLMIVGLWCAHPDCNLRPAIRQAVNGLNYQASLPILPSNMTMPMYYAPRANTYAFSLQACYTATISERG